jgi:hypothetical protein
MIRRGYIAAVASILIAGCNSRSREPLRIQTLTVENFRETAHEITVELRSEDEIVFEVTTDLPPAEERSGKIDKPSGETWRPDPTLDNESILRYQIDGGEWQTKTLGERGAKSENGCLRLEIELRSGGRSVVGWGYECFGTETE